MNMEVYFQITIKRKEKAGRRLVNMFGAMLRNAVGISRHIDHANSRTEALLVHADDTPSMHESSSEKAGSTDIPNVMNFQKLPNRKCS